MLDGLGDHPNQTPRRRLESSTEVPIEHNTNRAASIEAAALDVSACHLAPATDISEPHAGMAKRSRALRSGIDTLQLQQIDRLLDAHPDRRIAEAASLGIAVTRLEAGGDEGGQKSRFVHQLGADRVVAVGNGMNDVGMLEAAALGIAVLGHEGLAARALLAADVVALSITEVLDLLLHPRPLVASLRR